MEASLVKKSDKPAEETANEAPDVAIADDEETTAVADDQSAELKAEAKKNLDGWQRTLAEFQNYRRRIEREQQDMRERIQLDVLKTLLPIIDDFERAMVTVPDRKSVV
jgi:molecular chaperone GrpE